MLSIRSAAMDLHSSSHPSPPAFQATITLAMELENKLKPENGHGFNQLPQQTRICGTESEPHVVVNGAGENEEEADEEDEDVEKQKVNSRLSKVFDAPTVTDMTSPSDLKKDAFNNSDVLESELMDDEDDDDSMGRSSPGSYADLSPSVDNSKEGEDLDDDFDLSVRKFGNPMVRGRLQDGSPQTFGVNGGRPESSEGDYYDYNHIGGAEMEGIGVENGNGDKFYPCHLCSFTATTKSHFNSHMNTHYNHKCNHCDYTSRTEGRLKRHMKDFHPELQSEGFSSSRILKVDREGNHGDSNGNSQGKTKTYRCKQCSFSATVKAIFWEHTKGHIKAEKLLTCPKCPFVTEYKHHLEYHLRNHFGSKPFKCPKCNYSCVNKSMLNSHMKSHSNVYQYRCSDCTYATKYCHSLKLHLRKYTHKPAIVLNPDGTPNPIPVIDVYGTRRGPRQKKSQAGNDEQKRFCNGNGNSNGGGAISFSPMPVRGALSPATIVPYFYSGASGPLSNGFQSGMDGLLRPGNVDKSPTGASLPPPPPPPHLNNNSNHSSNGTIGTNSTIESESMENEKHHSKNAAIKCNLCPYITEQREMFSKHMILHAAAENQDLCSLYGINSESLMMDPTQQQQISASAMSAMAAAFGLNNNARSEVHRQSIPVSLASTPVSYDMIGHSAAYRSSPNSAVNNNNNNYNKDKHNRIDGDGLHMNGIHPMPSSLDHLRIFSEQPTATMYNMAREFSVSHYVSPNMVNYALEASPNTTDKSSTNSYSPGANSQKVTSHNSKNSKEGAISTKNQSPLLSQNTASGLGPLDLSGTKNGSCASRVSSNSSSPQNNLQQLSPHQQSPASKTPQHVVSSDDYENLQVNTEGISCTPQADLVSPTNQTKHRRKGKAFKLDRICMKLQKDYSYSDSPSDEMAADDSMGEYDLRSRSSDPLINDADDDFKIIEIKEEPVDLQNESESPQLIKEVEMNGNMVNGKKSLLSSKTLANSLKHSVDPKRSSPKYKSSNVIDLIDGDQGEIQLIEKNGSRWKEAFECQYCDMAFKDCIMYTVHMGYHGFKDPFKCNMCGHQAHDKVAFFLHIARTAHL